MNKIKHIIVIYCSILFTGCVGDVFLSSQEDGGTETVSYGVAVDYPVRSLGDGTTANYVWYALYKYDGTLVSACSTPAKIGSDGKTLCQVNMVRGQSYKVVFVATYFNVDGTDISPVYSIDAQSATLTMPTEALANSDRYDMFYGVDEVVDFQGIQNTDIILDRAVAQINFNASDISWSSPSITPSYSSVALRGVPSSLDLLNGMISDACVSVDYLMTEVPADTDGTHRVAAAYCLAPAEGDRDVNISAELSLYDGNSIQQKQVTAANVPLSANKMTNLIINL